MNKQSKPFRAYFTGAAVGSNGYRINKPNCFQASAQHGANESRYREMVIGMASDHFSDAELTEMLPTLKKLSSYQLAAFMGELIKISQQ